MPSLSAEENEDLQSLYKRLSLMCPFHLGYSLCEIHIIALWDLYEHESRATNLDLRK